ncbi:hypothetical protein NUSPORA_02235 [Nucleospora cyclopteri]
MSAEQEQIEQAVVIKKNVELEKTFVKLNINNENNNEEKINEIVNNEVANIEENKDIMENTNEHQVIKIKDEAIDNPEESHNETIIEQKPNKSEIFNQPKSFSDEFDDSPNMALQTETLEILNNFEKEVQEADESCLSKFFRFLTCKSRNS